MKQLSFIITGLPRSGLAWVSNYLTHGDTLCVFDALKHGAKEEGPACLVKMLQDEESPEKNLGIADHGAPLFQDYLTETFPDAKWVIVRRPYQDCLNAIKTLAGVRPDMSVLDEKIKELRAREDVQLLEVEYDSLHDEIRDVAKFIGVPQVSSMRHDMLCELNVQMDLELALDQAKVIPFDNPLRKAAEMPKPTPATLEWYELIKEICGENQQALDFLDQAVETALFFDHVADGDAVSTASLDKVMKSLMVLWPNNQFLRQSAVMLTHTIAMSIEAWKRGDAYQVYVQIPAAVAFYIGGTEYVERYTPQLIAIVDRARRQDEERDNPRIHGKLTK